MGFAEIHRIALEDGTDLTPGLTYVSPDDGNPDDRTLVSVAAAAARRARRDARLPRRLGGRSSPAPSRARAGRTTTCSARSGSRSSASRPTAAGTRTSSTPGPSSSPTSATTTSRSRSRRRSRATSARRASSRTRRTRRRPRARRTSSRRTSTTSPSTACPRFEVVRDTFSAPGLPNVDDHPPPAARPPAACRTGTSQATKVGLADYGTRYLPYPYPVVTVVDPPWGSHTEGMEYPTLFVGGARELAPAEGALARRASPSTSSGTRSSTGCSPRTSSRRRTSTRASTRTRRRTP